MSSKNGIENWWKTSHGTRFGSRKMGFMSFLLAWMFHELPSQDREMYEKSRLGKQ
jgi:hypothetical protein